MTKYGLIILLTVVLTASAVGAWTYYIWSQGYQAASLKYDVVIRQEVCKEEIPLKVFSKNKKGD